MTQSAPDKRAARAGLPNDEEVPLDLLCFDDILPPTEKQKPSTHTAIWMIVGSVGISILCAVVACVLSPFIPRYSTHCQSNDKAFRFIENNAEDWLTDYQNRPQTSMQTKYGDVTHHPSYMREAVFIVRVSYSWPSTPEGSRGYVYTKEPQEPSIVRGGRYDVTQMTDHIYCYARKPDD